MCHMGSRFRKGKGQFWDILTFENKSIGSLSVMYAKMTEPSEMPFGWLTSVSPRNRVLDGVEIPAGRGNFWGLSSPFKGIGCLCCDVCNKRDYSVLNSVDSKIFDGNYRL